MVESLSIVFSQRRVSAFLMALPFLVGAAVMLIVRAGAQDPASATIAGSVAVSPSSSALGGVDSSVKPGEDFYRYANGGWLARSVIPAGQQGYDTRSMLKEKTSRQVRDLMQNAAASHSAKGSLAQKVGDFYVSFMDEAGIEAKGLTPLADEMAAIAAIKNKASLSAYLGSTLNSEVDGLTANADHVLGVWINQGFEGPPHNLPHLWQGGLGLPDRDNYLDSSPQSVELRARYQAHIAAVLKIAGFSDVETRAAHILAFETRIARTFAPDSDAADTFKQNNPWKRADFDVKAPGMDWEAYFKSAGLADSRTSLFGNRLR
jgi:putative endopeptidase